MKYLPRTEQQGDDYCLEDLLRLHFFVFLSRGVLLKINFLLFSLLPLSISTLAFLHSSLAFLTTHTVGQLIHLESAIC